MDALIMAGGEGTRMRSALPKPLIAFNKTPLIRHVLKAASDCIYLYRTFIAITAHTSMVEEVVDVPVVMTEGMGYVEDMISAIRKLGLGKTLVLSADIPLITSSDLNWVIREYKKLNVPALAVFVPARTFYELGLESTLEMDGLVPSGVNIVDGNEINGEETALITTQPSFAINVNTPLDLDKALKFSRELSDTSNKLFQ